jgi:AAA+ ATPase superfamily predicted ATPase
MMGNSMSYQSYHSDLQLLSDKPTVEDQLNFSDYKDILVEIAQSSDTPITVGVFGEWGSGKTSLMMMVEKELRAAGTYTVWFNAWKYEKEDALWRALILRILESLKSRSKRVEQIRQRLYAAVSTEELGKIEVDWVEAGKALSLDAIKAVAKLTLPLTGVATTLGSLAGALTGASTFEDVSKAISRQKITIEQERIASIEEFEKLYSELIRRTVGKKDKRLVIFIDDLDRCLPVRGVEIFEALKTFLDATGCVYFVACDRRVISQGILDKYGAQSGIDIDNYLEKIVQVPFEMPPIRSEDARDFIDKFRLGRDLRALTDTITTGLDSNPRRLKRFLNNVVIQRRIAKVRELYIKIDVLVKLACIAFRWKGVWVKVASNPTLLIELQKYVLDDGSGNRSAENPEISSILGNEVRLADFLRLPPQIVLEDAYEYIFLARTAPRSDFTSSRGFTDDKPLFDQKSRTVVTTQDQLLNYKNPFIVGAPVFQTKQFYGRGFELASIIAYLENKSPLVILSGLRRIGKSSILLQLTSRVQDNFVAAFIDMQSLGLIKNEEEFLFQWARPIARAIKQAGYKPPQLDEEASSISFARFERFVTQANATIGDKRLLLLIDEFEVIQSMVESNRISITVADYIRSLLTSRKLGIQMVIGVSDLYQLNRLSKDSSPLTNIGRTEHVGFLDEEAALTLLTEPLRSQGVTFTTSSMSEIIYQTSCHPYLLQLFGSSVIDILNQDQKSIVDDDLIQNAKKLLGSRDDAYFRSLWESLGGIEKDILVVLGSVDGLTHSQITSYSGKEFSKMTLRDLVSNDLVKLEETSDQPIYQISIPLWRDWIRMNYPLIDGDSGTYFPEY